MRLFCISILVLGFAFFASSALYAQDSAPAQDDDGSSEQVEQREDSYRQQMELEDARSRDRTYVDNTYTQSAGQEKIDKLPQESRENIRDQLVDIIVENGEWEPKDALEEYPYTPTEAAQADPELKQQEQEAWEEQIEKYHEREAAAFGTHRGPVPGPGNPSGQEGGQQGEDSQQGQQGGQQGSGQGGQAGEGKSGSGSAGTYQPGANGSEDEVSTAGVSESALDFLRGGQGRQHPPPQGADAQAQAQQAQAEAQAQAQAQQAQAEAQAQAQAEQQAQEQAQAESQAQDQQAAQEQTEESEQSEDEASPETVEIDVRGIIAIEDLDKLEGANVATEPADQDDP